MKASITAPLSQRTATVPFAALLALSLALTLALTLGLADAAQAQQTGSVSGQVVDAQTDRPLAGAQVVVSGTGIGALVSEDGRFLIRNVPAGAQTLRVEQLGYASQTREVTVQPGQTAVVTFNLSPAALGLDEIVVTGTAGAARRREVGNSVSQVRMAEVREPSVSVDGLLQARVPGMVVLQSSGMAGSGAQIRLRGNVSVAMSNQPIVYVDGVRLRSDGYAKNVPNVGYSGRSSNDIASPLNDINPADIERIEVIKGAAATTLYGTEAAAGVIQIFTKRGTAGAAQWTAQMDQGVAWSLPFGPDPSERPPSEPAQTAAGGTSDFMFINPWLRDARQQRYSLSVGGGGENLQYFASGTHSNNEGILPNDLEEKTVVRGNFTFQPMSDVQLQWNTSYTNTQIENTAAGNNAHGLTLNAFRRDRNYRGEETRAAIDPLLNQEITTDIDHLITGFTAVYTPTADLSNRVTIGYDLAQQNSRNFRPFGFALAPGGILSDRRHEFSTLTAEYTGTLGFGITPGLRSSFSWGGQSVASDQQETSAYGEDFPGPGRPTVSSAGQTLGFEARERVINAGFFLQNLFDLHNRYFLTLGVRVDGNSAFGQNLGLQAYPKASVSYVVSDEGFWRDAWGQLKLRGAWGQSGRAPGAFDAVRTYDPVGWGGNPAFFSLNVGNPDLGPERTTELEFGFDGAFIDNRLALEFSWYRQKTTDALFDVRQVPSLGFLRSQLENIGELENRGIELAGNVTAVRGFAWNWEIGGSLATNHSKVLSLGGAPDFSLGSFGWVVEGQPVPVIRSNCVTNPDEIAEPVIEQDCNHGPNLPTHIVGVNTLLQMPWGLTLSARGEYQGGHYMYDGAAFNAVVRSVRWPGCFDAYNVQEREGPEAMTAMMRAQCVVANTRADYFVYPADFFKVREVTLEALVPDGWIPGANRATVTFSGRNIWKWVNEDFPVFEPEMGNNDGFDTPVRSLLEHVPPPAVFTTSVRLVF
ncbi:MAG: TonB-dependent receptor [Gemmatimonadetes bacterium]|nr:TonB-dependent receptor [Gemmatimonadota bacterium]